MRFRVRRSSRRGILLWVAVIAVAVAAVAVTGAGTSLYKDWKHGRAMAAKEKELAEEKKLRLAETARAERHKLYASLLKVRERRGLLQVIKKTPVPGSPEFDIHFTFAEVLPNGKHGMVREGTVRGTEIFVFCRSILFKDEQDADNRDPSREIPHLLILDDIRGLGPKSTSEPWVIDSQKHTPVVYQALLKDVAALSSVVRDEQAFWDLMHDDPKRSDLGITAMTKQSNGVQPLPGHTYELTFSRTGAVLLDTQQPGGQPLAQAPVTRPVTRGVTTAAAVPPRAVAAAVPGLRGASLLGAKSSI